MTYEKWSYKKEVIYQMNAGNNKKKAVIAGIIVIVIMVVGIFLLMSNKKLNEGAIKRVILNDWNTLTEDDKTPVYIARIDELTEFEIIEMKYRDNIYDVLVNVEGIDLGEQLSKIDIDKFPVTVDEDELNTFLIEVISKSPKIKTKAKIQIEVINNDEYQVRYSEEFVDSMSGFIYTYSKNMVEQAINRSTKD